MLVATDFSEAAQAALEWAVAIVDAEHGSLHVLHVLQTIAGAEPASLDVAVNAALDRAVEARAWEQLRELMTDEEQSRLCVTLAIEWGNPIDEILRYVNAHRIDLVSLGHGDHGRKPLLGHVAEAVVRDAPCSVLTIRRQHAAGAA